MLFSYRGDVVIVGPRVRARIPQRPVANDLNGRRDVRRDGFHNIVRLSRSQAGVSVLSMVDGRCRRHHCIRAELLRLSCASILHRSAATGNISSYIGKSVAQIVPFALVRFKQLFSVVLYATAALPHKQESGIIIIIIKAKHTIQRLFLHILLSRLFQVCTCYMHSCFPFCFFQSCATIRKVCVVVQLFLQCFF